MSSDAVVNKHVPPSDTKARRLYSQSSCNFVPVRAVKRGGYRVEGTEAALNPYEKPLLLNIFIVSSFTQVGDAVLSLCAGSGSLNEICMFLGR